MHSGAQENLSQPEILNGSPISFAVVRLASPWVQAWNYASLWRRLPSSPVLLVTAPITCLLKFNFSEPRTGCTTLATHH